MYQNTFCIVDMPSRSSTFNDYDYQHLMFKEQEEQDHLLLASSFYPTAVEQPMLPTDYWSSPSTADWSSCSSSPSLDFQHAFYFPTIYSQQHSNNTDLDAFLLSDLATCQEPMTIPMAEPTTTIMTPPPVSASASVSAAVAPAAPLPPVIASVIRQEKSFACRVCERSFARKHDLQRHVRVHTGAKPYQCLHCKKAFARTDALKRHLRMEEACRMSPIIQAMKKTGSRRYRNL